MTVFERLKDNQYFGMNAHTFGICIVHRKHGIAHLGIPKNGTGLFNHEILKDNDFVTSEPDFIEWKKSNGLITAAIREPLKRFISQYSEISNGRMDTDKNDITKNLPFFEMDEGIDKFKQFIIDIGMTYYDSHLQSQSFIISPYLHNIDFIFILEDINNEIVVFNKLFNKELPTPVKEHRKSRNIELHEEIFQYVKNTYWIYNFIHKKYREDFELYDYVCRMKSLC